MKLTIGLPTYNGAATLPRALDSLLAQDLRDLELIVSDNGSTDRTPEICRRPGVRYLREDPNRGPTWNFNRVLGAASGAPFFMWAADDDRWAPDFASSCIAYLDAHPEVALCGTRAAFVATDGRETGEIDPGCSALDRNPAERAASYLRSLDRNSVFYGVYRTSHLGSRRLENRVANDQTLLLDLVLAHPIHTLPAVKFWRQVGGTSASVARISRVLGLKPRYPAPFNRIEVFEGLFDAISRSPHVGPAERGRLKREALVSAARRYLRRLRSPAFWAAKGRPDPSGR